MEQGLTGVESRRCSAPSRGKAAARVVRRCGVRWGRRGVRLGLRRAGPGISACAPTGKVAEISGGHCSSAGKTELTAWVPRVSGRGVMRRLRERAGRWAERGVRLAAGPCGASVGEAGEKALAGGPGLSGTARARTS